MTDIENLRELCQQFINGDKSVGWIEVIAAMIALGGKDQHSVARVIEHAFRPGEHTNV